MMGRNAGWLTAASSLARINGAKGPDLIYLCEPVFSTEQFIADVKAQAGETGCSIGGGQRGDYG